MTWKRVAISEVSNVVTGSTPKTNREDFFGGDIPFVTPAELEQATPIVSTPRTLSPTGAQQVRLIPPNAILVCCIGSLGKVGIAGRTLATNQQINAIVFDERKVWPRFGYYACRLLKPTLENMAPATTIAIVSKSKFQALAIPLPPLEEQKRIAAILDQADDLRRKRQRALDRLNQLGQAIFIEMFGDPTTNPMNWPVGTIRDLLDEVKYGTSAKANTDGVGIPILRMGNLTYDGKIDLSDLKHVELSHDDFDKYTTRTGDILFNRTNSKELVGKTVVVTQEDPIAIAGYLVRARTNERANPHYISAYLNSSHGKTTLRNMCKNIVGMANINAQEFQSIAIAIPPKKIQDDFAARLSSAETARLPMAISQAGTEALFTSLQARAFRGDL